MKSSDQRNYGFVLYKERNTLLFDSFIGIPFYNYFRCSACATSRDNGRRFDVNKCPTGATATVLADVRRANASTETSESD